MKGGDGARVLAGFRDTFHGPFSTPPRPEAIETEVEVFLGQADSSLNDEFLAEAILVVSELTTVADLRKHPEPHRGGFPMTFPITPISVSRARTRLVGHRRPRVRRTGARLQAITSSIRERISDEAGYTTETVIVTALLAAAALTVLGIIVAKITGFANGIQL